MSVLEYNFGSDDTIQVTFGGQSVFLIQIYLLKEREGKLE